MLITGAKFVMLDTATIGGAAVRPNDLLPKELLTILRSGEWMPYLTWHHLEELISHANADVFRSRVDLLFSLPHLGYLKQAGHVPGEPYGGCVADVRDYEIAF